MKEGFYWLKSKNPDLKNPYTIGRYSEHCWFLIGSGSILTEDYVNRRFEIDRPVISIEEDDKIRADIKLIKRQLKERTANVSK